VKIFGIGLNKTGTTSLHEALLQLGFDSFHYGDHRTDGLVRRALEEGLRPLTYVGEQHDAYSDIAVLTRAFATVDAAYPGSRFILTVRDVDDWLSSRVEHVEVNRERKARGEYDGWWLEPDVDRWRREWDEHVERVTSHFAGRPDHLLALDIAAGDGFDVLCPFLGVPTPATPFPRANTRDRRGGPTTTVRRLGRAVARRLSRRTTP
jgi:hypothetical protein